LTADEELVVRQAFAGLCWSKQFYYFNGSSQSSNGTSDVLHLQVHFVRLYIHVVTVQEHNAF